MNEIQYFLYKNDTEGAVDAGDDLNNYIATDIAQLCENDGFYLHENPDSLLSVRDNIQSNFMLISEGYLLLLMVVTLVAVTIIIPQKMKEHHVPMLLR